MGNEVNEFVGSQGVSNDINRNFQAHFGKVAFGKILTKSNQEFGFVCRLRSGTFVQPRS